jgi:hypothetical protein
LYSSWRCRISTTWSKIEGNIGFGGSIIIIENKQGRVYPITLDLWKWEIRELEPRNLLQTGTAANEEAAKFLAIHFLGD